jgi:hypothetical protein
MSAALPPVAPGAIPDKVRAEGPKAVEGFEAALGFERLLLSQMLAEALPEEGGGEGALGGGEPRAASMAETFADAISAAGGVGIAASLYAR